MPRYGVPTWDDALRAARVSCVHVHMMRGRKLFMYLSESLARPRCSDGLFETFQVACPELSRRCRLSPCQRLNGSASPRQVLHLWLVLIRIFVLAHPQAL